RAQRSCDRVYGRTGLVPSRAPQLLVGVSGLGELSCRAGNTDDVITELPRPGGATAYAGVGRNVVERSRVPPHRTVRDSVPGPRAAGDRTRVQPFRRRPPQRLRPAFTRLSVISARWFQRTGPHSAAV